jgi:hypothetical protein
MASIHSAPRAVASKSNSLLCGVGHSRGDEPASRLGPSEVDGTRLAHADTIDQRPCARARRISGRWASVLVPTSMNLDDQLASVREHYARDAADAGLVEDAAGDAGAELSAAEGIDRPGDHRRVVGLEDGELDVGRRGVPLAQMRRDDRSEVGDAIGHG